MKVHILGFHAQTQKSEPHLIHEAWFQPKHKQRVCTLLTFFRRKIVYVFFISCCSADDPRLRGAKI